MNLGAVEVRLLMSGSMTAAVGGILVEYITASGSGETLCLPGSNRSN